MAAPEDMGNMTPPLSTPIPTPAPTGAQTDAGKAVAPVLAAVLDYLGQQVGSHPIEAAILSYAKAAFTSGTGADAVAGILGGKPFTLRAVVDAAFQHLESIEKRPLVRWATQALNTLVDTVGLPALQLYLATLGIPIPLA